MGAVTAIMAASKIKVDCIICDSAFYEFKTVFTEIAEKNELLPSCLYEICYYFLGKKIEDEAGFKLDDLSTIEYLGKMKETDIFFMVGE